MIVMRKWYCRAAFGGAPGCLFSLGYRYYWSPISVCFEMITIFYDRCWWEHSARSLNVFSHSPHTKGTPTFFIFPRFTFSFPPKHNFLLFRALTLSYRPSQNRYTCTYFVLYAYYCYTLLCSATFTAMLKRMFLLDIALKRISSFDFQFLLNPRAATPNRKNKWWRSRWRWRRRHRRLFIYLFGHNK